MDKKTKKYALFSCVKERTCHSTYMATPIRKRAGGRGATTATTGMKKLAVEHFTANLEANRVSSIASKARAELYKSMKLLGLGKFSHTFSHGKDLVTLECEIKTPQRDVIDIELLKKQVTRDVFDKIVSASKGAVVTHAGTAVAKVVSVPTNGTENVTVKVKK